MIQSSKDLYCDCIYLQTCLLSLNIVINKHLKYIPNIWSSVSKNSWKSFWILKVFFKNLKQKQDINSPLLLGNVFSLDLPFHISPFDLVPLEAFWREIWVFGVRDLIVDESNLLGVLTTKLLEDREFQFVYISSLLSNTQFIKKQNVSKLQFLSWVGQFDKIFYDFFFTMGNFFW